MAERHKLYDMDELAPTLSGYEERSLFPDGVDPQFFASRNERPQPFHAIFDHDTVLVQVTGSARVQFHGGPVRYQDLEVGDFLYVPAGTPHRIVPHTPSVHYRIGAARATLQAVAFHCEPCGAEVAYESWDPGPEPTRAAYERVCGAFNATDRTCPSCGTVAPPAVLD